MSGYTYLNVRDGSGNTYLMETDWSGNTYLMVRDVTVQAITNSANIKAIIAFTEFKIWFSGSTTRGGILTSNQNAKKIISNAYKMHILQKAMIQSYKKIFPLYFLTK